MSDQPTDDELAAALRALRIEQPTAGVNKLHASLLAAHTTWLVSQKRTHKILQREQLLLGTNTGSSKPGAKSNAPEYRLNQLLDVSKLSKKIDVKDFGKPKGKGIVLTEPVKQGETVWKEDPFIFAATWEVLDHVHRGNACAHCISQIKPGSSLIMTCPGSRLPDAPRPCSVRFCSRLCLQRAVTHPLICTAQNPSIIPLLLLSRELQWQALLALATCAARIVLATDELDQREAFEIYQSLAYVEPGSALWKQIIRPTEAQVQKGYDVYKAALVDTKDEQSALLRKTLKTAVPLPENMHKELFTPEGYRRGIARMNLNLEQNGGLHALHSHLNHSCDPNVSAKHVEQRTALSRLSVISHRDLEAGEELTISYVDPSHPVHARRLNLRAWGIPHCDCKQCTDQEKELKDKGEWVDETTANSTAVPAAVAPTADGSDPMPQKDLDNLEGEIKQHLGFF
ncbi:hypothetical protein BKA62DRAFT_711182 [Auriculariales sp. MPI-PUGE-AT-0066]|nr:hypothetical protein BKA62DRAFT_711182 [Auriculariales sp. MPI-PUGE-AT-0066]